MFSKSSRYNKLADTAIPDSRNRLLQAKSLRLLPDVSADIQHTLEEKDRLEHLAYTYYREPTKWWRICDANPGHLSPLELIGKAPVITECYRVSTAANQSFPGWAVLLKELLGTVGVDDVMIIDDVSIVEALRNVSGEDLMVYEDQHKRAIIITYNRKNTGREYLAGIIAGSGMLVNGITQIGRTGKTIAIPRNIV